MDSKFKAQSKALQPDQAVVENDVIRVTFSAANGMIEQAFNKVTDEPVTILQDVRINLMPIS